MAVEHRHEALAHGWWPIIDWPLEVGTSLECCKRWEKCPPCSSSSGPDAEPQHRQCWGHHRQGRENEITHHRGAIGQIRMNPSGTPTFRAVYVYDLNHDHHQTCQCAEAGHPGINPDTWDGRGDISWLSHRGIPFHITYAETCSYCGVTGPPCPDRASAALNARLHAECCYVRRQAEDDPDDYGTPSLFGDL